MSFIFAYPALLVDYELSLAHCWPTNLSCVSSTASHKYLVGRLFHLSPAFATLSRDSTSFSRGTSRFGCTQEEAMKGLKRYSHYVELNRFKSGVSRGDLDQLKFKLLGKMRRTQTEDDHAGYCKVLMGSLAALDLGRQLVTTSISFMHRRLHTKLLLIRILPQAGTFQCFDLLLLPYNTGWTKNRSNPESFPQAGTFQCFDLLILLSFFHTTQAPPNIAQKLNPSPRPAPFDALTKPPPPSVCVLACLHRS